MKKIKRILSLVLALTFIIGIVPFVNVSASTDAEDKEIIAGIKSDTRIVKSASFIKNMTWNTPYSTGDHTTYSVECGDSLYNFYFYKWTCTEYYAGKCELYTTLKDTQYVNQDFYLFKFESDGSLSGGVNYSVADPHCFTLTKDTTYLFAFPIAFEKGNVSSYDIKLTSVRYPADISFKSDIDTYKSQGFWYDLKYYLTTSTSYSAFSSGFVTYTSSDTKVATIDSNGIMKCLKAGTVTITVKNANDATIYATCTFTIKDDISSITTDADKTVFLNSTEDFTYWYKFTPSEAGVYSVKAITSQSDYAEGCCAYAYVYYSDGYGVVNADYDIATTRDSYQYFSNIDYGEYKLIAGKTYYIKIDGYGFEDDEDTISVTTSISMSNYKSLDKLNNLYTNGGYIRSAGSNRYETAIATANNLKAFYGASKFDYIVVASGDNYPDALAGASLCWAYRAPMLLVSTKEAKNAKTYEYIEKNLADDGTVFVLGGESAVTATTFSAIEDLNLDYLSVVRLSGATRYETDLEILWKAQNKADYNTLIIANGKSYADALSASAYSSSVLLINPKATELTEEQKEFIEYHDFSYICIAGGTAAVSEDIENAVKAVSPDSMLTRCAGANRYETSSMLAEYFEGISDGYTTMTFATGKDYPDGLTGGVLARALDAPLFLVDAGKTSYAKDFYENNGKENAVVFGGTEVLKEEVITAVMS